MVIKKAIVLALEDEELFEPSRIIQDDDQEEALHFLKKYIKAKLRHAMECG